MHSNDVHSRDTLVPGAPPPRKRPGFHDIMEEATLRGDLMHVDRELPLSSLRATDLGIEVPSLGTLELTNWSRNQLSRMLGIRWDRWFDDDLVSPDERAEEINRRLARCADDCRIRSRRYAASENGPAEGVLRGFVGPGYCSIDDTRILQRLSIALGSRVAEISFVRVQVTDRTSHYVALFANELNLGDAWTRDAHFPGFLMRNSEVGAAGLSLLEHWWRLVCTNGMVVPAHSDSAGALFYRTHRKTTNESIDRALQAAFTALPARFDGTFRALREAQDDRIEDPEGYVTAILEDDKELRPFASRIATAYEREPVPTRFGIVQAITLAAQDEEPDERLLLESFAGRMLHGLHAEPR